VFERFKKHLDESGLVGKGARVLVGFSGGADSACLVHMLSLTEVDFVAGSR